MPAGLFEHVRRTLGSIGAPYVTPLLILLGQATGAGRSHVCWLLRCSGMILSSLGNTAAV